MSVSVNMQTSVFTKQKKKKKKTLTGDVITIEPAFKQLYNTL